MELEFVLADLNPPLPADWDGYEYLVLELKTATAQYLELLVETDAGVRYLRIHPLSGVWIRAGIPLVLLRRPLAGGQDQAEMGNKPRLTTFTNFYHNQGPLQAVRSVRLRLPHALPGAGLEVRSLTLSAEHPGDDVLEGKPVVDSFGQWVPEEWPGKAENLHELHRAWEAESHLLAASPRRPTRFGGYAGHRVEGSGFFRVEKIAERWWFVDPEGFLFFSAGVNCVSPHSFTPVSGREDFFAEMTPAPFRQVSGRGGKEAVSFAGWNVARRLGENWEEQWRDYALRRMDAWGLNTIGNWSDTGLPALRRMPYVFTMQPWDSQTSLMGMPDIYAPDFADRVEELARAQCTARKEDPWLLGYFIGNEPAWPHREALFCQTLLEGPAIPMRAALEEHLRAGDSAERCVAFVHQTFERFLELVCAAMRRHDSNHLNLGIRLDASSPEAVIRMARIFDVYSHNIYSYEPGTAFLDRLHELTGKPIVIGEFHFGAPGRGMDAGLCLTLNEEEKAAAYRYYVENGAAHPALIGTHWFQWVDQPATGRFDGENYNIGLVDVTDRPYPAMVAALQATHARLYGVHSGELPPVSRKPLGMGDAIEYR